MKLNVEKGELSLPEGFELEMESGHPFFSEEGSASVPLALPASPGNLEALGRPDDIHNDHRHVRTFPTFLEAGTFQKKCSLLVESVGPDGISAAVVFNESEMYTAIQDRNLKDIFSGMYYVATKLNAVSPDAIYWGTASGQSAYYDFDDIVIFPVATDKDTSGGVSIINEPSGSSFASNLKYQARTVTVNGKSFSAPYGYGISVFMYLGAMIEKTFSMCGYPVDYNVFKEDDELKKIVVVNNCADMWGAGSGMDGFYYRDAVPNITVGELIIFLHDAFGAIVQESSGHVRILLIKDLIASAPDADLSMYAEKEYTINYPEPSVLEREFDTSIDSAAPAAETIEELRASYEDCAEVSSVSEIIGSGLFYVKPLGAYYKKETAAASTVKLGTDCFTYSHSVAEKKESLSAKNRFLPMVQVNGRYMPHIGSRIHRYIDVDKDTEADQPLQLCYAHLMPKPASTAPHSCYCGSSYPYYEDGRPAPDCSPLTPEGLSEYWEAYESLLLNEAPEIEVRLYMHGNDFNGLDMCSPKIFNNAKVLVKSMSYKINDSDMFEINAVLQLLPDYSDKVSVPEITFNSPLVWTYGSTRTVFPSEDCEILETDGLSDYTAADAPETTPVKIGVKTKVRDRWLRYEYRRSGWLWSIKSKSTHRWQEYFIVTSQGN